MGPLVRRKQIVSGREKLPVHLVPIKRIRQKGPSFLIPGSVHVVENVTCMQTQRRLDPATSVVEKFPPLVSVCNLGSVLSVPLCKTPVETKSELTPTVRLGKQWDLPLTFSLTINPLFPTYPPYISLFAFRSQTCGRFVVSVSTHALGRSRPCDEPSFVGV